MFRPATTCVLLFMCKTISSLMINALFFQSTGAMAADSDSDCMIQGIWEQLGKCIAVGLFATLFAHIPMAIFTTLHSRDFRPCRPDEREDVLKKWRWKSRALWILGP